MALQSQRKHIQKALFILFIQNLGVSEFLKPKYAVFFFFLSTQFSNVILRKGTQISVLISGWLHLFRTIIHMTEEPKPLHNPEAGVHTVFVPPAV